MGTKSRETIYGGSVRAAAERATEARKEADRLAVEAWNKRMLGFQGPAHCRARHRAATEGNADPRAGALHAVQGLLAGARLSVQAEPSCRAALHQDFGERSAIDVVARGPMTIGERVR